MTKQTIIQDLALPWAKLQRDCREPQGDSCRLACLCRVTASLSLIGHSADVAAVMQALLEVPNIARRLAWLLGKHELTQEECERLTALTALHDLGKINLGFQFGPFRQSGRRSGHVIPLVSL